MRVIRDIEGQLGLAEEPAPVCQAGEVRIAVHALSLIHISEPTRPY